MQLTVKREFRTNELTVTAVFYLGKNRLNPREKRDNRHRHARFATVGPSYVPLLLLLCYIYRYLRIEVRRDRFSDSLETVMIGIPGVYVNERLYYDIMVYTAQR